MTLKCNCFHKIPSFKLELLHKVNKGKTICLFFFSKPKISEVLCSEPFTFFGSSLYYSVVFSWPSSDHCELMRYDSVM